MFIVNFEQIPNFELLFLFDIEHDDKQTIAGMIGYMSGVTFPRKILNILAVTLCLKLSLRKKIFAAFLFLSLEVGMLPSRGDCSQWNTN